MQHKRNAHDVRNRSPLYVAVIVAMFGAGTAVAADTAASAPNQNGLMTFPNVRVVNSPQLATPQTTARGQTGFKAYIDPITGALREPTSDELMLESLQGQYRDFLQAQDAVPTEFVTQSGAIGLLLPESSMMFSVVRKADDGSLNEFCVVGPEAAAKLMHFKAPASSALNRRGGSDVR